jgi:Uri superfamily endonuclease
LEPPVPGFSELDLGDPFRGPGIYILLLRFDRDIEATVGSLGPVKLKMGNYCYVGSAKAGLWGRVKRHLSDPVKKKWHIDQITGASSYRKVFFKEYSKGDECRTARILAGRREIVEGFGCSDCKCNSHLIYLGPE